MKQRERGREREGGRERERERGERERDPRTPTPIHTPCHSVRMRLCWSKVIYLFIIIIDQKLIPSKAKLTRNNALLHLICKLCNSLLFDKNKQQISKIMTCSLLSFFFFFFLFFCHTLHQNSTLPSRSRNSSELPWKVICFPFQTRLARPQAALRKFAFGANKAERCTGASEMTTTTSEQKNNNNSKQL